MTRKSDHAHLLVIGSINHDHVLYVDDFPAPGETIKATASRQSTGGKGANQAAAAALVGASVCMLGCIGTDDAGGQARKELARAGVDTGHILASSLTPTGTAFITVSGSGENSIVIDGGANAVIDPDRVMAVLQNESPGTVILAQGELRPEVIERASAEAARLGLRFVLNLAPPIPLSGEALATADPLILNEHEARAVGIVPSSDEIPSWEEIVSAKVGSLAKSIVITLGGRGAVAGDAHGTSLYPVPAVNVKDTSGAGDAFCGTLAAFLTRGQSFTAAVEAGTIAGALSVCSSGTIESYPTEVELASHLSLSRQAAALR